MVPMLPSVKTIFQIIICLVILALGGMALQPLSHRLVTAESAANLRGLSNTLLPSRDALAEHLSFFLLGGLRSLAAEIMVLDATTAWAKRNWPLAERRWQMVTTLNPERQNYWVNAARDMAVNAAAHAINDERLDDRERVSLSRSYFPARWHNTPSRLRTAVHQLGGYVRRPQSLSVLCASSGSVPSCRAAWRIGPLPAPRVL